MLLWDFGPNFGLHYKLRRGPVWYTWVGPLCQVTQSLVKLVQFGTNLVLRTANEFNGEGGLHWVIFMASSWKTSLNSNITLMPCFWNKTKQNIEKVTLDCRWKDSQTFLHTHVQKVHLTQQVVIELLQKTENSDSSQKWECDRCSCFPTSTWKYYTT